MPASWAACVAGIILAASGDAGATHGSDPSAFFEPAVTLDQADRDRLDRRDLIVRILPAHDGELGVFGALKRKVIEERIRSESSELLTRVRDGLESGGSGAAG